ncbi:MAG: phage tail tape measure protein [Armatimonadota bacterium]|nr:phage tail tape measure protein [bacterium]
MARTVREMMLVFGGSVSAALKTATTDTAKRLQQVNEQIKAIDKAKIDADKFRKLQEKVLSDAEAFEIMKREVGRLNQELYDSERPSAKLITQFEKARAVMEKAEAKLKDNRSELTMLKGSLNDAGVSVDKLSTDMKLLGEREAVVRKESEALRKSQAQFLALQGKISANRSATADARGQLLDAAGMAAVIALPVKEAMDFESAMADVRKVVDGLDDPKKFQAMSKAIMDLTTKGRIPMAADQLAQIVAAGGQAGFAGKELIGFARDAAKMGIAFDITAEESGLFMSRWRKSFDLTQQAVVKLADKINYLGNTSGAKAAQISNVVTRIGPLGKIGGIASGEIAALGASMVSMGVEEELAATGIKKLIVTLNAGSAATKEQQGAFNKLGINAVDLSKRMQKDAAGSIVMVIEKLKQLPKYEQTATLKRLFGEEGLAAIGSVVSGLDQVKENLRRVGDAAKYTGSMQKEYETRSKVTANSLQILQNQAVRGANKFGSVLLPEIVKISEKLGPVIDKVVTWTEKNPKLWSTIVKVATGLASLRVATMGLRYAYLVTEGSVLSFLKVFQKQTYLDIAAKVGKLAQTLRLASIWQGIVTAAQWAWNTSLYGCPIVWIIAGIAALGAGIYLLVKHWDKVKGAMSRAWNWFLKFATDGPGKFIPIVGAIGQIAKHWDIVKTAVKSVWEWLGRAWDRMKKLTDTFANSKAGQFMRKYGAWSPAGMALNAIAKHARGGIFTQPHVGMVAESGPEAIIPLSNRARGRSLLGQAAGQLGMAGAGAGNVTVSFAPVINISGNADRATLDSALGRAKDDFKRMFEDLMRDMRRRSMA